MPNVDAIIEAVYRLYLRDGRDPNPSRIAHYLSIPLSTLQQWIQRLNQAGACEWSESIQQTKNPGRKGWLYGPKRSLLRRRLLQLLDSSRADPDSERAITACRRITLERR